MVETCRSAHPQGRISILWRKGIFGRFFTSKLARSGQLSAPEGNFMRDATDVLVIGGGPAGPAAAHRCAKEGFFGHRRGWRNEASPGFLAERLRVWGGRLLPRRLLTWRWQWVVKNEPQRARKCALGKKEKISGLKTHHWAGRRLPEGQGNA